MNAKRAAPWALGAAALVAIGAGIALSRRSAPRPPPPPRFAPLACAFAPGDERAYRLDVTADVRMDPAQLGLPGAAASGDVASGIDVRGRLALRALRALDGGAFVVAMRLVDARVTPRAGGVDAGGAAGADAPSRPWLVRMGDDCAFHDIGLPSDLAPHDAKLVETIVQQLEVVLAPGSAQPRWQRTQHDGLGTYVASYERLAGTDRDVRRARGAYTQLWPISSGARGAAAHPNVTFHATSTTFTVDARGRWLERLASDEDFELATEDHATIADVRLSARLQPAEPAPSGLADVTEEGITWRPAGAPPLPRDTAPPPPDPAIAAMPLDALLDKMRALLASKAPGAVGRASDWLRDALRANPRLASAIYDELLARRIDGDFAATVFLGLQKAGTSEAHAALVRAMDEPRMGMANRLRAVAALPDVPHPTQLTLDALKAASARPGAAATPDDRGVRTSATFAIGTLEKRARDKDAALAASARDEIRAKLRSRDPDERVAALSAVGNAGDGALVDDLRPHLASSDPVERKQAIEALGSMPPDSDADAFGPTYDAETVARLRALVVKGFADQARHASAAPPDAVIAAATARLATEPDLLVRLALVELLGLAAPGRPEVRAVLASQYAKESDPRIQAAIGQFVPASELP